MDEKDNSRSSLQTAADLGRAAKAAYRIAQAAAVSGVHGAAAAAVKETVPALVKFHHDRDPDGSIYSAAQYFFRLRFL